MVRLVQVWSIQTYQVSECRNVLLIVEGESRGEEGRGRKGKRKKRKKETVKAEEKKEGRRGWERRQRKKRKRRQRRRKRRHTEVGHRRCVRLATDNVLSWSNAVQMFDACPWHFSVLVFYHFSIFFSVFCYAACMVQNLLLSAPFLFVVKCFSFVFLSCKTQKNF